VELFDRQGTHRLINACRARQRFIMQDDQLLIGAQPDVQLKGPDANAHSMRKPGECIFRSFACCSSMTKN
jgi:hypothetical protein